jgi:two-component system sensor histidine kinase UhpB
MTEWIGDAEDASAVKIFSLSPPDMVLLDLAPKSRSGFEILDYITHHLPGCRSVILSQITETDISVKQDGDRFFDRKAVGKNRIYLEDQNLLRPVVERALSEGKAAPSGYRIVGPDDGTRYVYDYLEFLLHGPGNTAFPDHRFTERQQAGSERFHVFAEQLGGVPYIASLDQRIGLLYVSPKIEQMLGFTQDTWCNDPGLRMRQIHPDDRTMVAKVLARSLAHHEAFSIDYRISDRDGALRWLHDEARVFIDTAGAAPYMQGVMLDITERKAAQTELDSSHRDLQKLIAALETLREDEHKRLAQEIHDDLGQLLAAMKMDLANLQQRLPQGDAQLLQQLGGIQGLVDAMVASVRRIIADLPPKILEDMGLYPALALLTANFEKRHHILCRLDVPKPEPEVDARIAAPVYRIVQESLNNIAKHAGASRVDVRINFYDNHLVMCVIDDGRGMGMDSLQKPGAFGLIGMRERVTALDGDLTIESNGEGTTIQIVIPMSPSTAVEASRR